MAARTDRPWIGACGLGVAALALVACKPVYDPARWIEEGGSPDGLFDADQWAQLQTHALLADPVDDPTNAYDHDELAAKLGQKLFFDRGYAGSRTEVTGKDGINCTKCHDPEEWFQVVSVDPDDQKPWRNYPTLVNTAYYTWHSWDGRRDSLWAQSLFPPERPMHSDRVTVVRRMLEAYGDEYEEVFGEPGLSLDAPIFAAPATPILLEPDGPKDAANLAWEALAGDRDRDKVTAAYVNFGKALAAYQRRLVSRDSPFDRYLAGDDEAISEEAKRGLWLFEFELPCGECHSGPTFTDDGFHNVGTGRPDPGGEGRFDAIAVWEEDEFNLMSGHADGERPGFQPPVATEADRGKFRTKHLRQVAETARYMHDGSLRSLESVIDHYLDLDPALGYHGELDETLHGMRDYDLALQDREDLVLFLETLTGEPVPTELTSETSE
jgi:cytochrome c peroxidase